MCRYKGKRPSCCFPLPYKNLISIRQLTQNASSCESFNCQQIVTFLFLRPRNVDNRKSPFLLHHGNRSPPQILEVLANTAKNLINKQSFEAIQGRPLVTKLYYRPIAIPVLLSHLLLPKVNHTLNTISKTPVVL